MVSKRSALVLLVALTYGGAMAHLDAARVWFGQGNAAAQSKAPGAAQDEPFRFVAFGDMGTGDKQQSALAQQMATFQTQHPYETVLMLGDNIYPDGNPALFNEKFERPYAELLKRGVRFYAVLGNHDVRRGREAEMAYPNFNMGGRAYYSLVKGDGLVEFFALDSNNADRAQLLWLENALAASKATWKIAFFHHPLYSSGITHGSDTKLRGLLEPLFVKYGVALALSGHDHVYERIKPQRGVQYFVAGAGGQLRKGDLDRRASFYEAGEDEVSSFMYFEAAQGALTFQAIGSSGKVLDNGVILPRAAARSATAK